VKWLGEGAVSPLAIDGKTAACDLVPIVRQWCVSKGKNVVTPGMLLLLFRLCHAGLTFTTSSYDRFVRKIATAH
jgi:hypothetical protein